MRGVSAQLPIYKLSTLDAIYDRNIATERLLAAIAGFLGGVALLLVSVGVYGTLAYAAARRTREMGVRLALGAERTEIIRLLLTGAVAVPGDGRHPHRPAVRPCGDRFSAQGLLFGVTSAIHRIRNRRSGAAGGGLQRQRRYQPGVRLTPTRWWL